MKNINKIILWITFVSALSLFIYETDRDEKWGLITKQIPKDTIKNVVTDTIPKKEKT